MSLILVIVPVLLFLVTMIFVTNSNNRCDRPLQCTEGRNDISKLVVSQLTALPCHTTILHRRHEYRCYIRESVEETQSQSYNTRQVMVTGKQSKISSCDQPESHHVRVQQIEETRQHGAAANYCSCENRRKEYLSPTGSCCADQTTVTLVLPFYTSPVQETIVNDNSNQLVLSAASSTCMLPNRMVTVMHPIPAMIRHSIVTGHTHRR